MSDIVSPLSDKILPTKVAPVDATKAGRVGFDKPTAQNTIFLFIDHQMG